MGCYLSSLKVHSATFQLVESEYSKGRIHTKERVMEKRQVQRARGDAVHPTQPQPVLVTKQQIPSSKSYSPLVRARAGGEEGKNSRQRWSWCEGKLRRRLPSHLVSCGLARRSRDLGDQSRDPGVLPRDLQQTPARSHARGEEESVTGAWDGMGRDERDHPSPRFFTDWLRRDYSTNPWPCSFRDGVIWTESDSFFFWRKQRVIL